MWVGFLGSLVFYALHVGEDTYPLLLPNRILLPIFWKAHIRNGYGMITHQGNEAFASVVSW